MQYNSNSLINEKCHSDNQISRNLEMELYIRENCFHNYFRRDDDFNITWQLGLSMKQCLENRIANLIEIYHANKSRTYTKLNLSFSSINIGDTRHLTMRARSDFFRVDLDARGATCNVQPGVRRGGFRAWNRLKAAPRRAGVTPSKQLLSYGILPAYCSLPIYAVGGATCCPDRWSIDRIRSRIEDSRALCKDALAQNGAARDAFPR